MSLRILNVMVLILSIMLLVGCNTGQVADAGLAALDDAISSLEAQSANWQEIVNRLGNQLPEDAQAIVRQVEEGSRNVIATGGVEVRCNADFFGRRLKEELQRLRNTIQPRYNPPPRLPIICQISPDVITLTADHKLDLPRRGTVVRFFGYNFDAPNKQLLLLPVTGTQQRDLTRCLDAATTYQMTLNLGANACLNDIQSVSDTWRHIRLNGFSEQDQSPQTLTISYAPPPPCLQETRTIAGGSISLTGLRNTRGDSDFGFLDVHYKVTAQLLQESRAVKVKIGMTATEQGNDHTQFTDESTSSLSLALPPDYLVKAIETPTGPVTRRNTVNSDTDLLLDTGLVTRWNVKLKQLGDDDTFVGMTVSLSNVTVRIAQDPTKVTCRP